MEEKKENILSHLKSKLLKLTKSGKGFREHELKE